MKLQGPGSRPIGCALVSGLMVVLAGCDAGKATGAAGDRDAPVMDAGSEQRPVPATADAAGPEAALDAPAAPEAPVAGQDGGAPLLMTWIFQRCCPTDGVVLIRLVNRTTGEQSLAGPLARPTETASLSVRCSSGDQICFGAYEEGSVSGSRPLQWCLGRAGGPEDGGCCLACADTTVRSRLDCPGSLPGVCS